MERRWAIYLFGGIIMEIGARWERICIMIKVFFELKTIIMSWILVKMEHFVKNISSIYKE